MLDGKDVSKYYNGSQNPVKYLGISVVSLELVVRDTPSTYEIGVSKFATVEDREKYVKDIKDGGSELFWEANMLSMTVIPLEDTTVELTTSYRIKDLNEDSESGRESIEKDIKINIIHTRMPFNDAESPVKLIAAHGWKRRFYSFDLPSHIDVVNLEHNSFYAFSFPCLDGFMDAVDYGEDEDDTNHTYMI
ncbi:MAG: hypothetical protein J6M05_03075 [Cardiobacteriaceae bacterium]|nr:hypothetical protein [Cardiobacteriaceae bacterium]